MVASKLKKIFLKELYPLKGIKDGLGENLRADMVLKPEPFIDKFIHCN